MAGVSDDPFDLARFVDAQAHSYEGALAEIAAGAKRGHWMWYVFPQLAGLGSSPTARHYALRSLEEARAYLAHSLLGERLRACVAALAALPARNAERVFGAIDALKLRSSLTLFAVAGGGEAFAAAISDWFGSPDPATLRLLGLE